MILLLFLMCYNFLPWIPLFLLSLQDDDASSTQAMISWKVLVLLPVSFLLCMKYLRKLALVAVTTFLIEPVNK